MTQSELQQKRSLKQSYRIVDYDLSCVSICYHCLLEPVRQDVSEPYHPGNIAGRLAHLGRRRFSCWYQRGKAEPRPNSELQDCKDLQGASANLTPVDLMDDRRLVEVYAKALSQRTHSAHAGSKKLSRRVCERFLTIAVAYGQSNNDGVA